MAVRAVRSPRGPFAPRRGGRRHGGTCGCDRPGTWPTVRAGRRGSGCAARTPPSPRRPPRRQAALRCSRAAALRCARRHRSRRPTRRWPDPSATLRWAAKPGHGFSITVAPAARAICAVSIAASRRRRRSSRRRSQRSQVRPECAPARPGRSGRLRCAPRDTRRSMPSACAPAGSSQSRRPMSAGAPSTRTSTCSRRCASAGTTRPARRTSPTSLLARACRCARSISAPSSRVAPSCWSLLETPLTLLRIARALRRERPVSALFLHFKKEQLLCSLLPRKLTGEIVWAEWGPVPPPMRRGPRGCSTRWPRGVRAGSWRSPRGRARRSSTRACPAAKVDVVPNLVDVDAVKPDPASRVRLRDEWGAGEQTLVVGCISRFQRRKRNDVVIDAMAHLERRRAAGDRRRGRGGGEPARARERHTASACASCPTCAATSRRSCRPATCWSSRRAPPRASRASIVMSQLVGRRRRSRPTPRAPRG